MSALVRCPKCDTFVKPASIDSGSCPFCPSSNARNIRNPIPGIVLAATLGVAPACSGSSTPEPEPVPVYGIAIEETEAPPAPPPDAGVPEVSEVPAPVYGGPPDMDQPVPEPPVQDDEPVYGIAPD